jgi:hypothetical protein
VSPKSARTSSISNRAVFGERIETNLNGAAVGVGQFLVVLKDHDFEELRDSCDLPRAELIEQLVRVLFGSERVSGHAFPLSHIQNNPSWLLGLRKTLSTASATQLL